MIDNSYGENDLSEKTQTQIKRVLFHLLSGKSITPLDALRLYGSFRLGAIIFLLRGQGYIIRTDRNEKKGEARYAIYTMIQATITPTKELL